jgi:hypothetical protein
LKLAHGFRPDGDLSQPGHGPVCLGPQALHFVGQDLDEERFAQADKVDAICVGNHRTDVAARLGQVAPFMGAEAEEERPPPGGDRQAVHRRELQLVGRRLLAAGEAAGLAQHEGAREVAPDRGRVDPRRFPFRERGEPGQRLVFPSGRGQH